MWCRCSFAKSCPTVWPHGLQHTGLPCPSPSPGVYSNSCPLSQWCPLTIASLCRPLLLLPSIFPSIRVLSSESALSIMMGLIQSTEGLQSKAWGFWERRNSPPPGCDTQILSELPVCCPVKLGLDTVTSSLPSCPTGFGQSCEPIPQNKSLSLVSAAIDEHPVVLFLWEFWLMQTISPETSSCEGWGWELSKNGVGKEAVGGLTPVDLGCCPFRGSAGRVWIRVSRWPLVSQIPCRTLCAAHGLKVGFCMFQGLSKQSVKKNMWQRLCVVHNA